MVPRGEVAMISAGAAVALLLLLIVRSSAVADGGDGGDGALRAGPSTGDRMTPIQPHANPRGASRRRNHVPPRKHRSLVIGTPTGGGKYPFLVVVNWLDEVQDPRNAQNVWCHGTMIAPDVVLVSHACRPAHGYVMVGDSNNSSFVQFRDAAASNDTNQGIVSHPDGFHYLFPVEPVTFPGFYPATISKSPGTALMNQNVTVVGYGRNAANSTAFPGEAYEAQRLVTYFWEGEQIFQSSAPGVGPCWGDVGAPVLDRFNALVGMSVFFSCGIGLDYYKSVSGVADWIERNACALSSQKEDLQYCPDLVCPSDARLLGYPWALLPNGTGSVVGIRGFDPVRATQWPPPGTPLWRNTTTNVTITAYDATSGRKLECSWGVFVAPLELLGEVVMNLTSGTYGASGQFRRVDRALSGRVYKMSGRTSDRLRGLGSSVSAALRRRGSSRYTGRKLTLKQNEVKGAVGVPSVPVRFGLDELSDVDVQVNVTQNSGENNVTYRV